MSLFSKGQAQDIISPQVRQIGEDDPCASELEVATPSDNLSCEIFNGETNCYLRAELCNGSPVCLTGSDEGANVAALNCMPLTCTINAII